MKSSGETPLVPSAVAAWICNNPALNKGTAFTEAEREIFGLHGLLPPIVESLDDQCVRAYQAFALKPNDLERHIYLRQLQDTNEVLFYRLLMDHIEEMLPIVHTPVVALGCQEFSHIYRRPRGIFISYPLRHSIPALLRNHPNPEVVAITRWHVSDDLGFRAKTARAEPYSFDHTRARGTQLQTLWPVIVACQAHGTMGARNHRAQTVTRHPAPR